MLMIFKRDDVIRSLHATSKETAWVECDGRVSSELHLRASPAAVAFIPGILDAGVQVLLFAGAEDLICNYKGIERIVENLSWGGIQGMAVSLRLAGQKIADDARRIRRFKNGI